MKQASKTVVKFISVVLGIGSAIGVGVGISGLTFTSSEHLPLTIAEAAPIVLFIAIFGCCLWNAVELWRQKQGAYKWAAIIFAFQIPQFTLPSFGYKFYTGVLLLLAVNRNYKVNLEFNLSSSIGFQMSPDTQDLNIGVNLAALAACCYLTSLYWRTRSVANIASPQDDLLRR